MPQPPLSLPHSSVSVPKAMSTMNPVKQEANEPMDPEIEEMAEKIAEANKANKAKMAMPQRLPQTGNRDSSILSFLGVNKHTTAKPTSSATDLTKNIDEESQKGRFGWITISKVHLPYIFRSGEHYCAVRMVEMKLLNKFLCYLHQDLYNCTNIRSYYITEAEARLLNEINFKHCDHQFGREQFTTRDLIVRTSDTQEFYKFLGHCYEKLINSASNPDNPDPPQDRCGFIRINRESVVPYTVYNGNKYVPLFYFEGETDNLKQRADKLEGWDLSYLKFCCKVQGIRNELFAHDSCSVISLNDIKNYFPPGTSFEDYWPKKTLDSQLLITGGTRAQANVQWTRQPTAPPMAPTHPPPSPKPATQAKAANNSPMHNVHVYSNFASMGGAQPQYHQQPRTASSAVRATYANNSRTMRPSTSYYGNITGGPPPLVRSSQTYPTYGKDDWQASFTNTQSNAAAFHMIMEPNLNQNNYHQTTPQLTKYGPPLFHMNGGMPSRHDTTQSTRYEPVDLNLPPHARDLNNYGVNSSQAQLINQQPAHQQPSSRTPTSLTNNERSTLTNGRLASLNTINQRYKLISIPDPPTSGNHIPYKIQKALVEGEYVPCINMKPYVYTDLLIMLPDLIANFFKNVPVHSCQQVMQVLGIDMYKPNNSQMRVLLENGKCTSSETVPLVQVRNVINYMPQLKYMLNGLITPDVSSKRQRTS